MKGNGRKRSRGREEFSVWERERERGRRGKTRCKVIEGKRNEGR